MSTNLLKNKSKLNRKQQQHGKTTKKHSEKKTKTKSLLRLFSSLINSGYLKVSLCHVVF